MYENFVVSTQHALYLLLEKKGGRVSALKFDFLYFKYGTPNDEGIGSHPMAKFGLGFYDLFLVKESSWIAELSQQRKGNTAWDLYRGCDHYIATFKDVTLDVVSRGFEEITMSMEELLDLITKEAESLSAD